MSSQRWGSQREGLLTQSNEPKNNSEQAPDGAFLSSMSLAVMFLFNKLLVVLFFVPPDAYLAGLSGKTHSVNVRSDASADF